MNFWKYLWYNRFCWFFLMAKLRSSCTKSLCKYFSHVNIKKGRVIWNTPGERSYILLSQMEMVVASRETATPGEKKKKTFLMESFFSLIFQKWTIVVRMRGEQEGEKKVPSNQWESHLQTGHRKCGPRANSIGISHLCWKCRSRPSWELAHPRLQVGRTPKRLETAV